MLAVKQQVGLVEVMVSAPEGVPAPSVILSFEPKTRGEFESVLDAFGGPESFSFPTREGPRQPAHWRGKDPHGPVGVLLYEPVSEQAAERPAEHPFFAYYAQVAAARRAEREEAVDGVG